MKKEGDNMDTWQQIGVFIILLVVLAEILYIGLIPYNINRIAESLEEISKSMRERK
ncbi:hypothetical protein [Clostridium butyricum]